MTDWNDHDVTALLHFLQSETGIKLKSIVAEKRPPIAITPNESIQPNFEAVAIGASNANGWESCFKFILGLAEKEKEEESDSGFRDMQ